jgi:hypothetical protein
MHIKTKRLHADTSICIRERQGLLADAGASFRHSGGSGRKVTSNPGRGAGDSPDAVIETDAAQTLFELDLSAIQDRFVPVDQVMDGIKSCSEGGNQRCRRGWYAHRTRAARTHHGDHDSEVYPPPNRQSVEADEVIFAELTVFCGTGVAKFGRKNWPNYGSLHGENGARGRNPNLCKFKGLASRFVKCP